VSALSIIIIFVVALIPVLVFWGFATFFAHRTNRQAEKLQSVYHTSFLLSLVVLFFVFSYNLYTTHQFSMQNFADYKLASDSAPAREALFKEISNQQNKVLCKQQDDYEWIIINPGTEHQIGFLIPLDKFVVLERTN